MNFLGKQSTNGLLAGCAIVIGWWVYGWQGILMAITVIVFWMLLQFNRAMRVMQRAGRRPVGEVDSAVMLQAKLAHGMTMQEVIGLTNSLGKKYSEHDEWMWTDVAGNDVVVTFRRGVVVRWAMARNDEPGPAPDVPASDQPK